MSPVRITRWPIDVLDYLFVQFYRQRPRAVTPERALIRAVSMLSLCLIFNSTTVAALFIKLSGGSPVWMPSSPRIFGAGVAAFVGSLVYWRFVRSNRYVLLETRFPPSTGRFAWVGSATAVTYFVGSMLLSFLVVRYAFR